MEVTCQATLSGALAQVLLLLQEDAPMEAERIMLRALEAPPFTAYRPEQTEDLVYQSQKPTET